jgi:peptidoglycan/xylan/chitin deacetylase (PgdA/CDA1 family)
VNPWAIGLPVGMAASAGLASWGAIAPSAQWYGPTVRRLPAGGAKHRAALTFDDGPNPAITPKLLDLLEKYKARATFFVIGRFARACPELIREIQERGHLLANHTETHPHLTWHSPATITCELRMCGDAVHGALASGGGLTGPFTMKWMRPPFGFRGPQLQGVVAKMGIRGVVMWSALCYDWRPQPAQRLINRLARVRAGDIVLMHDGDHRRLGGDRSHVLGGLEHWLPRWRDAGLEFVTIEAGCGA